LVHNRADFPGIPIASRVLSTFTYAFSLLQWQPPHLPATGAPQ
jgi:hypothetical protein